jgi:hypothetical protein
MNSREAQLFILHSEKGRLEAFQAKAMLDPNTTTKRTDIDEEILRIGEEIRQLNGNADLTLGPASHWLTKEGQSVHTEETAHTYPLLDATKQIGHVQHLHRKWFFKIFGRDDIPVTGYNTKEEALAGASCWAAPITTS